MDELNLSEPVGPWVASFGGTPAQAYELAWKLEREGATVRVVRGNKMRNVANLFNELGAAMQFPDYFGENWAAMDECLSDLSWMPGQRYVVVVSHARELLADEDVETRRLLMKVFRKVGQSWAEPVARGELWDRPAIPFHVLLQADAIELDKAGWNMA